MPDGKKYIRALEFGRERRFHELGVAVTVTLSKDGSAGAIEVRELEPRERFARKRDLTKRNRRV